MMIRWKCPECKHWWWLSDKFPPEECICLECGERFKLKEVTLLWNVMRERRVYEETSK
jgi:hypothetical protein